MNKSLLLGAVIGGVVAVAAGSFASYNSKQAKVAAESVPSPVAAQPLASQPLASQAVASQRYGESASTDAPKGIDAAKASLAEAAETRAAHARHNVVQPVRNVSTENAPAFGRVVSSTAVVDEQRVARQDCHDAQITQKKPVKDEQRIAGSAIGAVIGGILGNQVGDGDGRKLATAAGAVAGGVAGNKIQKRVQDGNTETVTEKRCTTVYDTKEKVLGYDVVYRVGTQTKTVRMTTNPEVGSKISLQHGRAVALAD